MSATAAELQPPPAPRRAPSSGGHRFCMLMSHLSHRMIECTQDLTHRAVQDGTQANHAATAEYVVARVQTKRVRFRAANDSSLVPEGFDVVPTTHVEF